MHQADPPPLPASEHARLKRLAAWASVLVALFLVALKLVAWLRTGSVTLLASLLDSLIDLFASSILFVSIRQAQRPADAAHRFGHGKAEPVGALVQVSFVAASAMFLLLQALDHLIEPQPLTDLPFGVGAMGVAILVTFGLIALQRWVIRRTASIAVAADRLHYTGDLLGHIAVLASFGLYYVTGSRVIDPWIAVGIALWLLFGAARIGRNALDPLMDRELPQEARAQIKEIVLAAQGVRGLHDLRTRSSGAAEFIELHLEIDGALTVAAAHDIADTVEAALIAAFPNAEIALHQEPAGIEDTRRDATLQRGRTRKGP